MVAWLTTPSSGDAFGTIRWFKQDAEHEKITRKALRAERIGRRTLDELAGKNNTWGAIGYPDREAITSNVPAAHCDNGDFRADITGYPHGQAEAKQALVDCRDMMFANMRSAITTAGNLVATDGTIHASETVIPKSGCDLKTPVGAKCTVLSWLGRSLHASQDFYAHSNWSDQADPGAPDLKSPAGLGNTVPAPFIDPAQPLAAPQDGLMTGCFEGFPELTHCPNRTKHDFLNKDEGAIDKKSFEVGDGITQRARLRAPDPDPLAGDNFRRAVDLAVADTQAKWTYFEQQVLSTYTGVQGKRIMCVLRSDRADVCVE